VHSHGFGFSNNVIPALKARAMPVIGGGKEVLEEPRLRPFSRKFRLPTDIFDPARSKN
jgi:hypothetical protein